MHAMARILLFMVFAVAMAAGDYTRQNYQDGGDFVKARFETRNNKIARNIRFSRMQTIEDLFNVYDASFLGFVWPKLRNGVHLSIDTACWDHLKEFYKDLLEGRSWAYTAVDASGRYESGLYGGSKFWLGSKHQCLQLDSDYSNGLTNKTKIDIETETGSGYMNVAFLRGRYFDRSAESDWSGLAQASEPVAQRLPAMTPPFRMSYFSVKLVLNVTRPIFKSQDITLGLCLPRVCSSDDLHSVLEFSIMINDNLKSNKTLPRVAKITSVRSIDAQYDIVSDATALLLVIVTSLLLLITVIATAVDYDLIKFKPRNCKSMSFDLAAAPDRLSEIPMPNNRTDVPIHKKYDKKPMNVVDMETLTINNMNNAINLVTVKKVVKPDAKPPSITLDVIAVDELKHDSCNRCGKYRKQCPSQKKFENVPACPRMRHNHSATSLNTNQGKQKCTKYQFCRNILLCFSIRQSWIRISSNNFANRDLSPIHLLKILATFWVIYVEVATVVAYVSNDAGDISRHKTPYNILVTGTLAFDILFFVSGVVSAHHFFYLKQRYSVEESVSTGGCCGRALQGLCFITNRAARLLPPYMYAIFLTSVVSRVTLNTSPLEIPEGDHTTCDSYWWTNLLYINTFYDPETRCMRISWYISLESQLHALGALLLCCSRLRGAIAAVAGCTLAAAAADAVTAYRDFGSSITDSFSAYDLIVDRPWSRVVPYFVGGVTGWLVHRLDGELVVSKLKAACFWSVSLWAATGLLMAPWCSELGGPLLWAAGHNAWAPALPWPAVALCASRQKWFRRTLDSRTAALLSRLSYGALLLHGAVARGMLLGSTALSVQMVPLWSYFCGVTAVSLMSALLLALLVEAPFCSLLRRLSDCASS